MMQEEHRRALEQQYGSMSKPTVGQREAIARALGLSVQEIQIWFQERRIKAKAEKRMEEMQTMRVLESANELGVNSVEYRAQQQQALDYRSQSDASYASLARSLAAAAACMPRPDVPYESQFVEASSFCQTDFPMASPIYSSFESVDMSRVGSQYSGMSTPMECSDAEYPWYGRTSGAEMPYGLPGRSIDIPLPAQRANRPGIIRTQTCPDAIMRPGSRRTVSSSNIHLTEHTGSIPRRRPKLSTLGVGMARSQSSLGYDSSEFPYPVKRVEPLNPLTPARRSSLNNSTTRATRNITPVVFNPSPIVNTNKYYPPSPISPEHAQLYHQPDPVCSNIQEFPVIEDGLTPPDTPITMMNSSQESINEQVADADMPFMGYCDLVQVDLTQINYMNYDLTLADIFPGHGVGTAT